MIVVSRSIDWVAARKSNITWANQELKTMSQDENPESRDSVENAYMLFSGILSILAMSPIEQCTSMGNYHVAWELRHDGLDVDYLLGQRLIEFTDEQRKWMQKLSLALHSLTEDAISCGTTLEANLLGLQNQEWDSIREIAKKMIPVLAPRTLESRKYFNLPLE